MSRACFSLATSRQNGDRAIASVAPVPLPLLLLRRLVGIMGLIWAVTIPGCVQAQQIATDGTVGAAARTLTGPRYSIGSDLGRQVGGNLFHSFSRFNLATGESATFRGPGSVANILARVTGG